MIKKLFFSAVLLIIVGTFGSANAQTPQCFSSEAPVTIPYATGSISISYNLCYPNSTDFSSFYWDSTMTYNNVSFDGAFSINGSMGVQINFTTNGITSAVFSGGPLVYTISGQTFTVHFNTLSFALNSSMQPVSWSGSLTINGVNYPADSSYFAYLFQ